MPTSKMPPSAGQTVGPFFHFGLIYPGSNELVGADVDGAITLRGTVTDGNGDGVPDALVEIWHAGPDGAADRSPGHLKRDGHASGFGRAATDTDGSFSFRTLAPGPTSPGSPPFFAVTVFARGLLDRLFTRAYLPEPAPDDALLRSLDDSERATLVAVADGDDLRFDIVLQGDGQTVFLNFDATDAK